MRKSYLKKVATKSFVGRVLRRLLGEEKGTVMMEYIVVGLLIAAACVIGVSFFGHGITGMFGVLSASLFGDTPGAQAAQQQLINNRGTNYTNAQTHNSGAHSGTPDGDQAWTN